MEDEAETNVSDDRERDGEHRRAYETPVIESGEAFERVLLLSGAIEGFLCLNPE